MLVPCGKFCSLNAHFINTHVLLIHMFKNHGLYGHFPNIIHITIFFFLIFQGTHMSSFYLAAFSSLLSIKRVWTKVIF